MWHILYARPWDFPERHIVPSGVKGCSLRCCGCPRGGPCGLCYVGCFVQVIPPARKRGWRFTANHAPVHSPSSPGESCLAWARVSRVRRAGGVRADASTPQSRTGNARTIVGRCSCTFTYFRGRSLQHGVKPWTPGRTPHPANSTDDTSRTPCRSPFVESLVSLNRWSSQASGKSGSPRPLPNQLY